jgi:hypothetical protein
LALLLAASSSQANALALIAAVEAARARKHGRSFAVVTSEVRTPARRSAQAAREIGDLAQPSSACLSGCPLHAQHQALARVGTARQHLAIGIQRGL